MQQRRSHTTQRSKHNRGGNKDGNRSGSQWKNTKKREDKSIHGNQKQQQQRYKGKQRQGQARKQYGQKTQSQQLKNIVAKVNDPAKQGQSQIKSEKIWSSRTSSTTKSAMTKMSFASLAINSGLKSAITDVMQYEFCTLVQQKSIPVALQQKDILAKAKTGTGKTLAFLIPACEKALRFPQQSRRGKISVLVVSPTRELCLQIFEEAKILCTNVNLSLQSVYGGTKIKQDLAKFRHSIPDILIATPGRLNDHLENYGLRNAMQGGLKVLIFDEADQVLCIHKVIISAFHPFVFEVH